MGDGYLRISNKSKGRGSCSPGRERRDTPQLSCVCRIFPKSWSGGACISTGRNLPPHWQHQQQYIMSTLPEVRIHGAVEGYKQAFCALYIPLQAHATTWEVCTPDSFAAVDLEPSPVVAQSAQRSAALVRPRTFSANPNPQRIPEVKMVPNAHLHVIFGVS